MSENFPMPMEYDVLDNLPDFCTKRTLILGCGNLLFGDDGFGPAVIEYLRSNYEIPDDTYVMDVGTGVRELLFTIILSPEKVQRVVIIDAIDKGKAPGEIFELPIEEVSVEKIDDLSLHQMPSSNLAKELMDVGVDVRILCCQAAVIPGSVGQGLSEAVKDAVARMCRFIAKEFFVDCKTSTI